MAEPTVRELVAEYELLRTYNNNRLARGHDYGCGARGSELGRRRREIEARDPDAFDIPAVTRDELVDAFDRVGEPRYRRAQAEAEKYGSPGVRRTAEVWRQMKAHYARQEATV